MELIFKKALKEIKVSSTKVNNFSDLLFSAVNWSFLEKESTAVEVKQKTLTEKSLVLDSLEDFSKTKIEENAGAPIKFEGGEVRLKEKEVVTEKTIFVAKTSAPLPFLIKEKIGEELFQARFQNDKESLLTTSEGIKVFFVTEEMELKPASDTTAQTPSELDCFLGAQASLLFEKMIKAMKLEANDYMVGALNLVSKEGEKESYLDLLHQEILATKPKLIITLGAKPTNKLLDFEERLMNVHGNFYKQTIKSDEVSHQCELMPLFHPELLTVAQEMKRSAWQDMQKAMKFLE